MSNLGNFFEPSQEDDLIVLDLATEEMLARLKYKDEIAHPEDDIEYESW